MRFLIFHHFIIERGGGERVIKELSKLPGDKLIVTSFYIPEKTYEAFKDLKIICLDKFISKICEKSRILKVLVAFIFFKYFLRKFSKYFERNFDVAIFSGFYSIYYAPYLRIKKVYYIQAEPLFMVFERIGYKSLFFKILKPLIQIISRLEEYSLKSFDLIVSNSKYTRTIFSKYRLMANKVIYPPVETRKFKYSNKKEFFLFVGRLYPHKRIIPVVKVFIKIKDEQLKIVGMGPLADVIRKVSEEYKNIEYLGVVDERKLTELFSRCKAVIYIPEKEHFGLVPVEANASGKPAIVNNEGGIVETIIPGKTGIIIKKPYEKNLEKVIRKFDEFKFDPRVCIKNARKFDAKNFRKKFERVLLNLT